MDENQKLKIDELIAKLKTVNFSDDLTNSDSASTLRVNKVDGEDAYVVGNSLICFAKDVSGQNKEDAIISTLLAQLLSSEDYNRESETMHWYGFYYELLNVVAWEAQNTDFAKVELTNETFKLRDEIYKVIVDFDEAAVGSIDRVIESLKNNADNADGLAFFSDLSMPGKQAACQICYCKEVDGAMVMLASAFILKSDTAHDGFLWSELISAQSELEQQAEILEFSSSYYDYIRPYAIDTLGPLADTYTFTLEL